VQFDFALFAETAEQDDEAEKQADAFLILQCIDKELDIRERRKISMTGAKGVAIGLV
jgi:hypothetical protein